LNLAKTKSQGITRKTNQPQANLRDMDVFALQIELSALWEYKKLF
jgi:hypothetical protein